MELARQRVWEPLARHRRVVTAVAVGAGLAASYAIIGWIYRYVRNRRRKAIGSSQQHGCRQPTGRMVRSCSRCGGPTAGRPSTVVAPRHRNSPSINASLSCLAERHDRPVPNTREALVAAGLDNMGDLVKLLERAQSAAVAEPPVESGQGEDMAGALCELIKAVKQLQLQLADLAHTAGVVDASALDSISVSSSAGNLAGASGPPTHTGGHPLTERTGSGLTAWRPHRTLSVLSDDSFFSAMEELTLPSFEDLDITLRSPLDLPAEQLLLYDEGRRAVARGDVVCRVHRVEMLNCGSDDDFLAKVYCVRLAFNILFSAEENRNWLMHSGRRLIAGLLQHAKKEPNHFYESFDRMMEFCGRPGVHDDILEELRARRVAEFNFYDVVLDFILMDAFDDLAAPPSAVFAVTRNRYLSDGLKESTLRTIIYSVLRGKRARLSVQDGFIGHFYDLSETVSPVLAWGFLGTDDHLRDLCYYFKEQMCNLMVDIFNVQRVRYTRPDELAEDVWALYRARVEMVEQRISGEPLPAEG